MSSYLLFTLFLLFQTIYAAVSFTTTTFNSITAGSSFTLTWTGASGSVTINLLNGPSSNIKVVSVLGRGLSGTSFTWAVPSSIASDTYAFSIADSQGTNYSPQFKIIGAGGGAASTAIVPTQASTGGSVASSATGIASTVPAPVPTTTSTIPPSTSASSAASITSEASSPSSIVASITSSVVSASTSAASSSALSQLSSSSATASSAITSAVPASSAVPLNSDGGLSTGAKAGIGVGASLGSVGIIALIIAAFLFGKKSSKKKHNQNRDNVENRIELGAGGMRDDKGELEGTALGASKWDIPLSEEEKARRERKRRAAELEGGAWKGPAVEIG